jgi:uncharacterized membrane protein YbaN (DUF454 family)
MDETRRIDGAGTAGKADRRVCAPLRYGLIAFGWINIGLGVGGMFLPVMPTTVFLLIALWAFSRSSRRFHHWLYNHPTLGRTLRDWHRHRVIPPRVKILAVSMMTVSLSYVTLFLAEGWALPLLLVAVLGSVSAFILSRPSRPAPLPKA